MRIAATLNAFPGPKCVEGFPAPFTRRKEASAFPNTGVGNRDLPGSPFKGCLGADNVALFAFLKIRFISIGIAPVTNGRLEGVL